MNHETLIKILLCITENKFLFEMKMFSDFLSNFYKSFNLPRVQLRMKKNPKYLNNNEQISFDYEKIISWNLQTIVLVIRTCLKNAIFKNRDLLNI